MMAAARATRTIERVPPLLISLLVDAGKLERAPFAPAGGPGFRRPGISEAAHLTWLVVWAGEKTDGTDFNPAAGCIGYEDRYDFHRASDVREIVYLSGKRRACVELVRFVRDSARAESKRCIGCVDEVNDQMADLLGRMGGTKTRVMFEDLG